MLKNVRSVIIPNACYLNLGSLSPWMLAVCWQHVMDDESAKSSGTTSKYGHWTLAFIHQPTLQRLFTRPNDMASSIVSRHGRTLGQAVPRSPSAALVIPGFLVPAWQDSASRQQFSTTTKRPSKLGRTPLTVPPGVEILISDPITTRKATEWKSRVHKSVTVKGPLGSYLHHGRARPPPKERFLMWNATVADFCCAE